MAFAHGHDEIVILGHLAQMAMGQVAAMAESPFEHRRQPDSHHAMALANFFRELTSRPIDFAFALRHAVALADGQERENPVSWLPVESAGTALLDTFLAQFVVGKADLDRLVTLAIQLNEFYARWITSAGQAEPIDFFRD